MNPFDLKSALLAKHAQHVVLIHFPIALFLTGVVFDYAAHWTKRQILATAAYVNTLAAAAAVIPVLGTGIAAWQWQLEGTRLHGVLLLHLVLGCLSGLLICVTAWLQVRGRSRFALEFVAVIAVVLTGHLGGILSGVNVAG